MQLYMDVHERLPDGAGAEDVARAHQADLATQDRHGVRYLKYWVDEANGKAFCLVEAPDPDAAIAVHLEAHGLIPDRIHPVIEGVPSFTSVLSAVKATFELIDTRVFKNGVIVATYRPKATA